MLPPTSTLWTMRGFRDAGLDWVENTPEELEAAVIEMLERTDGGLPSTTPDDDLQQRFKALAETCSFKYGGQAMKAFASISRDFLESHAGLLENLDYNSSIEK